jgi:hypothetical protein
VEYLGSVEEVTHSVVGLNGSFNGGGGAHFVPGIEGNAVMAMPVLGDDVNDRVSLTALRPTFRTILDTTGCPAGFVGEFSFDARLTNQPFSPLFEQLEIRVSSISNGNLLQNADGGPGGAGAILIVPPQDGFADGFLSAGEFVDVPFIR